MNGELSKSANNLSDVGALLYQLEYQLEIVTKKYDKAKGIIKKLRAENREKDKQIECCKVEIDINNKKHSQTINQIRMIINNPNNISAGIEKFVRGNNESNSEEEVIPEPTIEINPVQLGKEKIDYISNTIISESFYSGVKGDTKMFELIHFTPTHPENRNIKLIQPEIKKGKKTKGQKEEPKLLYFDGITWSYTDKDDLVCDFMNYVSDIYFGFLNKKPEKSITAFDKRRYQTITERDPKYKKDLTIELMKVIKNYSN